MENYFNTIMAYLRKDNNISGEFKKTLKGERHDNNERDNKEKYRINKQTSK